MRGSPFAFTRTSQHCRCWWLPSRPRQLSPKQQLTSTMHFRVRTSGRVSLASVCAKSTIPTTGRNIGEPHIASVDESAEAVVLTG
jgi:hypothetical protein